MASKAKQGENTPEDGAPDGRRIGLFSWITATFMGKLMSAAQNDEDSISSYFISDSSMPAMSAYKAFNAEWTKELNTSSNAAQRGTAERSEQGKSGPSLVRALWRTFRGQLMIAAGFKLVWGTLVLLSISYFVRQLLAYIRFKFTDPEHTSDEAARGILLAFFFFVATVLLSVALQQMTVLSSRVGLRLRAAVSTSVYRKSLVIDRYAPGAASMDVVSLVATDCNKLGEACTTLHYLWSGVVEAIAIMGVLLGFVGRAALPGLGILVLLVPVQYAVGMAAAASRKKVVGASEARVRLMDEILRAIKLVKMYAWEGKFAESVAVLRNKETGLARVGGILKSLNLALVFVLPPMIALGIFGVQTLYGDLDATMAFTTLSIFNTLRLPLVQLPKALRALAEARTAAERVQAYLLAPDASPAVQQTGESSESSVPAKTVPRKPVGIVFLDASFTYAPGAPALLRNINFNLRQGSLTMVAGPVASGKSNLIMAILGQMRCVSGTHEVSGSFAYVPQTPWCAHGTVRDNILFGKPWDEQRYRRVIFACALERDLGLLDDGDLTEIGERGMNLSGGQKQRIALARAAYSGADIILLDSALSAVDMYTCTHIVTHLITGMLATEGTTTVLVTHQAELFHKADNLVIMQNGAAVYAGPYDRVVVKTYFPNASATPDADADLLVAVQASPRPRAMSGVPFPPHDVAILSPVAEAESRAGEGVGEDGGGSDGASADSNPNDGSGKASPDKDNRVTKEDKAAPAIVAETPERKLSGRSTADSRAAAAVADWPGDRVGRAISNRSAGSAGKAARGHRAVSMDYDALVPSGEVLARAMTLRGEIMKSVTDDVLEEGGPEGVVGAPGSAHGSLILKRASAKSQASSRRMTRGMSMSQANMARALQSAPSSDLVLVLPGSPEWEQRTKRAKEAKALADAAKKNSGGGKNSYLTFFFELRWYLVLMSLAVFVITQVTRIYSDIWISLWTSNRYAAQGRDDSWYLGVYGGYVATFLVLLLLRGLVFYAVGLAAASRMHGAMFTSILRAPMSFFTLTPLGTVLSVFSRDMDGIDEALLDNMHMVVIYLMILCTTIAVVIRVLPVFAVIAVALLLCSAFVFRYYLMASKVLKHRAGTTSSSVVAHVSETLQGISVIKAYKAEKRFAEHNVNLQTNAQTASYTLELLQLWLTFRQDFIGCCLVLATCMLCVALESRLSPADAGLAVSNSFQILLFLSLMIRGAADVHAYMASVDRVSELGRLAPEPDLPLTPESMAKDGWPSRGEVDFHGVVMSYLPNAPHVLKGVDFTVLGCEKIGVVGRTGAGKSSLIMALLRLAPLSEGAVRIDGVDMAKLTLAELRRRVAIIPQEPVMFEGTLRSNLDPFLERTDEELVAALDKCLLSNVLSQHPAGLEQPVAHMGENFSLGQQQLMCLCRALLNKSRLLLLDEATAALDTDTDAAVQKILRTAFADRTVITIAHRLDTIIDSDRILVMDAGRVAEFASPSELLRTEGSIFAQLCKQTGAGSYAALRAAADRHASAMRVLQSEVVIADAKRQGQLAASVLHGSGVHPMAQLGEVEGDDEEDDEGPVSDGQGSYVEEGTVIVNMH